MFADPLPAEILTPLKLELRRLASTRGRPALLVHGRLDDDIVRRVYEALREFGPLPWLDVVLTTSGGAATATRRVAALLDEIANHIAILVPMRARSAGTLLCLCSDELVLTSLAELGPLDSLLAGVDSQAGPAWLSSEDVRGFGEMATAWFGVAPGEQGLELLGMLAQQVFPASLTQLYRFDALTRVVAADLLRRHLPLASHDEIERVVQRLVNGYPCHDFPITRAEARAIGLNVSDADPEATSALLAVYDATVVALGEAAQVGPPVVNLAIAVAPEVLSDLPAPCVSEAEL